MKPASVELRAAAAEMLGDSKLPFDAATTFTRYPAPFLRRHEIWALDYADAHHAVFLFVSWAEGEPARLLSGRPEAFVATARADGVTIASPDEALVYATTLLEATRETGPLLTVLRSAADLPLVPDPTDAERAAIESLEIVPPSARAAVEGYAVALLVTRDETLLRLVVDVGRDGGATVTETELADDLPLVCA
jgi:hypothetical protein